MQSYNEHTDLDWFDTHKHNVTSIRNDNIVDERLLY